MAKAIPSPRTTQPHTRVNDASAILKRFYTLERGLMRACAGWFIRTRTIELKHFLAGGVWQRSRHADALRTRILELRFPRRDVDKQPDREIAGFVDALMRAGTVRAFFTGVYEVAVPGLITAIDEYLVRTDALDDAPTVAALRHVRTDLAAAVEEARAVLSEHICHEDEPAGDADRWRDLLGAHLRAIGGVSGLDERAAANTAELMARPAFELPRQVRRDARFRPAHFHLPHENKYDTAGALAWRRIESIDKRIAMQVWSAVSHFNEIWAAEVPASVLYEIGDAPWEFYLDLARWMWDESRHSYMGYRALEGWGWDVPNLVPYGDALYNALAVLPPQQRLALLYYYEEGLLRSGTKQTEIRILESAGDAASSHDMDYDWADEAIHVSYGFKWLRHFMGTDEAGAAELQRLTDQARDVMADYVRTHANNPESALAPYFDRLYPVVQAMAHDIPDDQLDIQWSPVVADSAVLESL